MEELFSARKKICSISIPKPSSKVECPVSRSFQKHADADGIPVPEYFVEDRLYLAAPGYVKWAEALLPVFQKLELK